MRSTVRLMGLVLLFAGPLLAAEPARRPSKEYTIEQFLATFGKPLAPRQVGEHVATILTDATYESGIAFALRGDSGIQSLDA